LAFLLCSCEPTPSQPSRASSVQRCLSAANSLIKKPLPGFHSPTTISTSLHSAAQISRKTQRDGSTFPRICHGNTGLVELVAVAGYYRHSVMSCAGRDDKVGLKKVWPVLLPSSTRSRHLTMMSSVISKTRWPKMGRMRLLSQSFKSARRRASVTSSMP